MSISDTNSLESRSLDPSFSLPTNDSMNRSSTHRYTRLENGKELLKGLAWLIAGCFIPCVGFSVMTIGRSESVPGSRNSPVVEAIALGTIYSVYIPTAIVGTIIAVNTGLYLVGTCLNNAQNCFLKTKTNFLA